MPLAAGRGMPAPTAPAESAYLERARGLARLLDRAVSVPGTRIGFGLDGLLGLIPGVGDAAGGALSLYVLYLAHRAGAPGSVLVRMAGNVALDTVVGGVPLLGDLFDLGFKANLRNIDLLERSAVDPRSARRASRLFLAGIFGLLALVLVGIIALVAIGVSALGALL